MCRQSEPRVTHHAPLCFTFTHMPTHQMSQPTALRTSLSEDEEAAQGRGAAAPQLPTAVTPTKDSTHILSDSRINETL